MSGFLSPNPYKLDNKNNVVNEEHHSPNLTININNSIRRALSADMSSEKWVQENGFPLKRVQSSEDLQTGSGDEEMTDNKLGSGGAAFEDICSILSQKKTAETEPDSAPYVHPLVKPASSLSEKSLEICTERLGSETGSDGFSNPSSDHEKEQEREQEEIKNDEVVKVVKCDSNVVNKKINVGVQRSFPPPLPSLARRDDGSNLHMRTHRQDGRLVVDAVSVPSKNCLRASRQGGHLLLTLANDDGHEADDDDEEEMGGEDVGGDNEEKAQMDFAVDETVALPRTAGVIYVTRQPSSALVMNKLMELASTRNMSNRPRSFNMTVEVESALRQKTIEHALPPRPRAKSTATTPAVDDTRNSYKYYWRRSDSPTAAAVAVLKPLAGKQNIYGDVVSPQVVKDSDKRVNKFVLEHKGKVGAQDEVVLVGGRAVVGEKGEYLVPILRGCKEQKRSFFFWEPYCIATS